MKKSLILFSIIFSVTFFSLVFSQIAYFSTETDCQKCNNSQNCLKCVNSKISSFMEKESTINTSLNQNNLSTDFSSRVEIKIHELINQQRKANYLMDLQIHPILTKAARLHSQDMAEKNYFAHDSIDGRTFSDRILNAGLKCASSAENIADLPLLSESQIAIQAVNMWMNSEGHKKNILGYYSYEGIGVKISQNERVYITQDFC